MLSSYLSFFLSFPVPPEISVPSELCGVAPGTDVTLSCQVQAHPPAINYWMKDPVEMLLDRCVELKERGGEEDMPDQHAHVQVL